VECGMKKCIGIYLYTEIFEIYMQRIVVLLTNTVCGLERYPCATQAETAFM
jgi:hypothetical protein